jgi:hypothetical protein
MRRPPGTADTLTPALRKAWLDRLREVWRRVNHEKLADRLRPPVFTIDVGPDRRLGRWEVATRTLGISEAHIWQHPWLEVVDTLKHEMAHQVASELLGAKGETAHGASFAQACRMVGVDAAATGAPKTEGGDASDRILAKVRKLMALAASPNAHEAEAAMAAAHALLLKYNLDLPTTTNPDYGARRLGESAAALPLEWKLVASILGEFFFVECIWLSVYNPRLDRDERLLEVMGSHTNLEMAAYAHDFLHHACEQLWRQHAHRLRLSGARERREFVAGVLMGFRDKLRGERQQAAGRGLVWLGDPGLKRWFRERHPSVRSMSGGGVRRGAAHEAGVAAGQDLRLHRGIQQQGAGGKLLGRD